MEEPEPSVVLTLEGNKHLQMPVSEQPAQLPRDGRSTQKCQTGGRNS